jgi:general secretion pathway protein H
MGQCLSWRAWRLCERNAWFSRKDAESAKESRAQPGGFTLVELLVVLLLLSLLLAVVPPLFSRAFPGLEARGAARSLAASLRNARSEAVFSGHDQAVIFDLENKRYQRQGSGRATALPGALELDLVTAREELLDDRVGAIRFYPDGSSTGGRVTLGDERGGWMVDVDWLSGRIDIHERDAQ